ncbi:MAG TPA: hypothetical protein DEA78_04425, partial [Cyanobacteria bacterium UBA11159]|nr:hypothetical protein [Cyanobacteria bacterium UBA11159]
VDNGQLTITGWKSNCLLRESSASLHDVIYALTDVAVAINNAIRTYANHLSVGCVMLKLTHHPLLVA